MRQMTAIEFNRYIFRFLIFAFSFCIVPLHAVSANALEPLSRWQVSHKESHSPDVDMTSSYCLAKVDFTNGDDFVLARDYSGSLSGAYKSHKSLPASDTVILSIDNSLKRRFNSKLVNNNTIIFPILHDFDFLDYLMAGEVLTIRYAGIEKSLSLRGSANGIRELNSCLKAASGNHAALGRGSPNKGHIPKPGSLSDNVLPKYAGARKLDAFTDPSRTYIKVHYPAPTHSNTLSIGAAPVETVERFSPSDPVSVQVCRLDNIQDDFLKNAIEKYFVPNIKTVSNDNVESLDAPVAWEKAGVKSHFILAHLPQDEVQGSVLNSIERECGGEYALDKVGKSLWQGMNLTRYDAACFDAGGQTYVNLNFISDGFNTAIYSLETSADNILQSNAQRRFLLNNL